MTTVHRDDIIEVPAILAIREVVSLVRPDLTERNISALIKQGNVFIESFWLDRTRVANVDALIVWGAQTYVWIVDKKQACTTRYTIRPRVTKEVQYV